jgi:predicted Zn-dependent protease
MEVALFDIGSETDTRRIREALELLTPASLTGYSPSTIVVLRAGLLIQERLYADARRELVAGLAADPDEPTLHLLLGDVYERIGLVEIAAREFAEARDRVGRRR